MTGATGADSDSATEPVLRVVKGDPAPDELAALITALTALSATPAPDPTATEPEVPQSAWAQYWRSRGPVHPTGPDAWRRSLR